MNQQEILQKALAFAQGKTDLGHILGIDVTMVRQLALLVRGLRAAGRTDDACVFLDGLLALYPNDPELLRLVDTKMSERNADARPHIIT